MKYSEFKVEVEKLGFVVDDSSTPIYVDKNEDGGTVMSIGRHQRFWLDPGWGGFEVLDEGKKLELYALGYELAKTPLAEREEETRYYLVLNLPLVNNVQRYLNKIKNQNEYYLGSKMENRGYQTIFTESEISHMDTTGFEKVEVAP